MNKNLNHHIYCVKFVKSTFIKIQKMYLFFAIFGLIKSEPVGYEEMHKFFADFRGKVTPAEKNDLISQFIQDHSDSFSDETIPYISEIGSKQKRGSKDSPVFHEGAFINATFTRSMLNVKYCLNSDNKINKITLDDVPEYQCAPANVKHERNSFVNNEYSGNIVLKKQCFDLTYSPQTSQTNICFGGVAVD